MIKDIFSCPKLYKLQAKQVQALKGLDLGARWIVDGDSKCYEKMRCLKFLSY